MPADPLVTLQPPPPFPNPATGAPYPASIDWHGLPILVENTRYSARRGVNDQGERWESEMPDHYGEVFGTVASDGDALDVFVGRDPTATHVYVVATAHPDGSFDEVKAMLNYPSRDAAMTTIRAAYDDSLRVLRVTDWTIPDFIARCRKGDVKGDWRHGRGSRRGFHADDLRAKACQALGIPEDTDPAEVRRLAGEHLTKLRAEMAKSADGWQAIPGGHHGGERRPRPSGGWDYRYPDTSPGKPARPHKTDDGGTTWYHGTKSPIEGGRLRGDHTGMVYLAQDPDVSAYYGPNISKHTVRPKKVLDLGDDPYDTSELEDTLRSAGHEEAADHVKRQTAKDEDGVQTNGVFSMLRSPKVVDALLHAGYDGVSFADDHDEHWKPRVLAVLAGAVSAPKGAKPMAKAGQRVVVDGARLRELLLARRQDPHPGWLGLHRFQEMILARRVSHADLEAAGQIGMFGASQAGLVPKRVMVEAHTTTHGVFVPQHTTTVHVRREEPPAPSPEPPAADPAPTMPHEREATRSDRDVSTWDVPPHKLAALQAKIEGLRKKAARLGIAPPTLEILGAATTKAFTVTEDNPFEDGGTRTREVMREVIPVRITGPVIKAPGWDVVGMFEPTPAGNLLTSFSSSAELPAHLHSADATCEHCNLARDRKRIFVMSERATGKLKKIGGSCVEEFTGLNPHAAAGAAAFMQDFYGGAEGEFDEFGAGREALPDTIDVLVAAAYSHLKFGFIRSWDAGSTADHVRGIFGRHKDVDRPRGEHYTRAKAHAEKVLAWMKAIPANADSSYMRNLRTLADLPQIPNDRSIGLLASAPQAYERAMGEARRRETETFFGKPGDKIGPLTAKDKKAGATSHEPVHVRLASKRVIETGYGPQTILRFEDQDGHTFVWKTSADKWHDWATDEDSGLGFDMGVGYIIAKASIDEHNEFRGAKETKIVRPKILLDISPKERAAVDEAGQAAMQFHRDSRAARGGAADGSVDDTHAELRARREAMTAHITARTLGGDDGAQRHLEDLRDHHRNQLAALTDSGHVFVPTTLADLPRVQREGVTANVGRLPFEVMHKPRDGAVVVAQTPGAAVRMAGEMGRPDVGMYSSEDEHRAATPVMLRARAPAATFHHNTAYTGDKFGAVDRLAPDGLEFWAPGEGWQPVSQHNPAVHTHHQDLVSTHFPDQRDTGRHVYHDSDLPDMEGAPRRRGYQVGYRPSSWAAYHAEPAIKAAPSGRVAKRVLVHAHTRVDGTHVPQHETTVYVHPDDDWFDDVEPHVSFEAEVYTHPHEHMAAYRADGSTMAVATPADTIAYFSSLPPEQVARFMRAGMASIADLPSAYCVMLATSTPEGAAQMKGGTITHNHPTGLCFSRDDLALAERLELREIRATGIYGTWSASARSSSPGDWRRLSLEFESAMRLARTGAMREMDGVVLAAGGNPNDGENAHGFDIHTFRAIIAKHEASTLGAWHWESGGSVALQPGPGQRGLGRHGGDGPGGVPAARPASAMMVKATFDQARFDELLRAKRASAASLEAAGQISLFGGHASPEHAGLVPKQVTVAAHTTSQGVHVPAHQATVYARAAEAAPDPHAAREAATLHELHGHLLEHARSVGLTGAPAREGAAHLEEANAKLAFLEAGPDFTRHMTTNRLPGGAHVGEWGYAPHNRADPQVVADGAVAKIVDRLNANRRPEHRLTLNARASEPVAKPEAPAATAAPPVVPPPPAQPARMTSEEYVESLRGAAAAAGVRVNEVRVGWAPGGGKVVASRDPHPDFSPKALAALAKRVDVPRVAQLAAEHAAAAHGEAVSVIQDEIRDAAAGVQFRASPDVKLLHAAIQSVITTQADDRPGTLRALRMLREAATPAVAPV